MSQHEFDDYDTHQHSDESREAEYYDEYVEWMEGEELPPEPMEYDDYYPDDYMYDQDTDLDMYGEW